MEERVAVEFKRLIKIQRGKRDSGPNAITGISMNIRNINKVMAIIWNIAKISMRTGQTIIKIEN